MQVMRRVTMKYSSISTHITTKLNVTTEKSHYFMKTSNHGLIDQTLGKRRGLVYQYIEVPGIIEKYGLPRFYCNIVKLQIAVNSIKGV